MCKKLLALTCLLFAPLGLFAQSDTVVVKEKHDIPIYFRFDDSNLDFNYEGNGKYLDECISLMNNSSVSIDSISMIAQASPEGSISYNQKLAARRANSLKQYFTTEFPDYADRMTFGSRIYTWRDLGVKIMHDNNVPELDRALQILTQDVATSRTIQRQLKGLSHGQTYEYLEDNYLKDMRSSATCLISYNKVYPVEAVPEPEPVDTTPVYVEQIVKYPVFAFRSNLLFPLTNIGAELPLGNRWSLGVDWYSPWIFRTKEHKWAFQLQFLNIEGRYWFGKKHSSDKDNRPHRLTGHSIGAYVYGGKYDFQRRLDQGYQGEFFSVGLDYMYALPIFNHRMRLEFEMAVGYFHNRSIEYYVPELGGKLVASEVGAPHKFFNYGGPTKVGVSLVLPLFKKYTKTIKLEAQK